MSSSKKLSLCKEGCRRGCAGRIVKEENDPSVSYADSSLLAYCPKLIWGNNAHVKTSQEHEEIG